jgi:hypothetical protein
MQVHLHYHISEVFLSQLAGGIDIIHVKHQPSFVISIPYKYGIHISSFDFEI